MYQVKDFDHHVISKVNQVRMLHHWVYHDPTNVENDRVKYVDDFLLELLLVEEFRSLHK